MSLPVAILVVIAIASVGVVIFFRRISAESRSAAGDGAQVVIAIVSLTGLGLAIYQSSKTSVALSDAADAFRSFSFPTVKFVAAFWNGPQPTPDCDHPAFGLSIWIQNFSGVPVAEESIDVTFKLEDRAIEFKAEEGSEFNKSGEVILPPGGRLAAYTFSNTKFSALFPQFHGDQGPHLHFRVDAVYRSLVTGKRYRSVSNVMLLADCGNAAGLNAQIGPESIEELPATTAPK